MWSPIAKVVDNIIEAELSGRIESNYIKCIVNTILDYIFSLELFVANDNIQKFDNKEKKDQ